MGQYIYTVLLYWTEFDQNNKLPNGHVQCSRCSHKLNVRVEGVTVLEPRESISVAFTSA